MYTLTKILFAATLVLSIVRPALAADSPHERMSMDAGWRFHLGDAPDAGNKLDYLEVKDLAKTRANDIGKEGMANPNVSGMSIDVLGTNVSFAQPGFDDQDWRTLDLPHDWVVELPFDEKADRNHGFKPVGVDYPENSVGWYRREFDLSAADKGRALWLVFDGVYRNSLVWLNGHCLGRHLSGYTGFRYDISRFANYGGKNELSIRVDASRFEGWFYEGAGIYRHVWLEKAGPVYVVPGSLFVSTPTVGAREARVRVALTITNGTDMAQTVSWHTTVTAPDGKIFEGLPIKNPSQLGPGAYSTTVQDIVVQKPQLWDLDHPALYHAQVTVEAGGKAADQSAATFGIRTLHFDADKGFFLNGHHVEIQGTCNHQDHAGVGTAIPDALQVYRVEKLKAMGCNAIRTSHNAPTPELLDACDRLGMLVMDENRRMDTNDYTLGELRNLIVRDRNHPSVFIWSLGNEEGYLQGTNVGATVAATMQKYVHELDPTRLCTAAMNGKWGLGFSTVIDVQGFNYGTRNIDKFREAHPTQLCIGTETASTRVTRGIYVDDKAAGYVAAYGTNGIETPWRWWPYYADHPFTSGGFVWTGFDYRGEPTPYRWPCINSHFGLMDMCGFPKDIYYYYQSWWTTQPVLHIMPHWNWPDRVGQDVPVRIFSNCREVELFLNGKSLGKQTMQRNGFLDWNVKYEPGELAAKGYNDQKLIAQTAIATTGPAAAVRLVADHFHAGSGLAVVNVSVEDAQGRVVPTADNLVRFEVSGGGKIIGVGNGDPSSHESDKANQRKVFCGLAQAIVQAGREPGTIRLTAVSDGLRGATLEINLGGEGK